ncbi:MAG: hypothetical protein Q8O30_01245 [Candidatus Omnitrophota bacterium]|nr:hypothetical protein [Candidatus Omnitrophota bacterium]
MIRRNGFSIFFLAGLLLLFSKASYAQTAAEENKDIPMPKNNAQQVIDKKIEDEKKIEAEKKEGVDQEKKEDESRDENKNANENTAEDTEEEDDWGDNIWDQKKAGDRSGWRSQEDHIQSGLGSEDMLRY